MDEIVQLLRQAKGLLDRAERLTFERMQPGVVATAQDGEGFDNPESPQSWLRYFRFLSAVDHEGPNGVDVDRQRNLMQTVGYPDNRASGGFFSGGAPSLWRDATTDRRFLTVEGRRRIELGRLQFGAAVDE